MQSGYLSFDQSIIHYLKYGSGKRILFCFHGYGESSSNFSFLSHLLKNEFAIIALDLPFHGETKWENGSLDANKLESIIQKILQQENLPSRGISLIGFSLGGRIALSLYEKMSDRIDRLVLLAPDGLKLNFWYWLSTQTYLGNKTFKLTMKSPGWFLGMLRFGNRVKLINRSIYKFVEYYIHDERVRQELYDRWTCMRKCRPTLSVIHEKIAQNQVAVRLLYGKHDRIILASPAERFIEGLNDARITILDCGHQVLHQKNAEQVVNALIN